MTAGKIRRGINFAHPEGAAELLLDLYLPAAPQRSDAWPAVVHYHGGGWRTGGRSSLGPTVDVLGLSPIERLVDAGFAVASADYRLSSVANFPAQLLDAKAAVRWLRAHAADYNVDPDRIYVWGDSAGGHLASLVGLTGGSTEYPGRPEDPEDIGDPDHLGGPGDRSGVSDSVAAVAAWYPPTDLLRMGEQRLPDALASADDPGSREALLLGARPAEAPEKAAAASPLTYAGNHAPPFFLAHGTADRFVPPAQSTTLALALEAAGADVELLLIEGADHMWQLPGEDPAAATQATDATIDFFRRQAQKPLV